MAQGYRIVTRIKRADPDYIPSLIGIHKTHDFPTEDDQYFESIELEGYRPGCIETVERTNMVAYDSIPLDHRDPIIKLYGKNISFHSTMSDAYMLAEDEEDGLLLKMLDALSGKTRL